MNEEIEKVLNKFKKEGKQLYEDCYDSEIYEYEIDLENNKIRKEYNLEEEIEKVFKKFGVTQYNFCSIGSFDSPGYSLYCMCIAYIDLKGRLQTIPINYELY